MSRTDNPAPADYRPPEPPNWLYVIVVVALSVALLAGVWAWIVLTFNGLPMPDGLAAVLATIAGGLVGIVTPSGRRG